MAASRSDRSATAAGAAAALLFVIAVAHLQDGDWFSFDKAPAYVQVGYVLLEISCLMVAVGLVTRGSRWLWMVAAGCGSGPLVGYVLSRGPGMPAYSDDKGNWGEPLGIVMLVVESALILLCAAVTLTRTASARGTRTASVPQPRAPEPNSAPVPQHQV